MAVKSFSDPTNQGRRILKNLLMVTLVVSVLTLFIAGVAYANVRNTIPPDPFAPIYTDWYGNDEWVAFIFYRPPECVPPDFNIFNFFDFRAYGCLPLTVKGFVIYENPGDFVPVQAKLHGLGTLPVWFVSLTDYDNAKSGGLYMAELKEMSSLLIGSASFYNETLHPEGHPTMPMKNIVARGTLEDNRSFRLHALWVGPFSNAVNNNVKIDFR
jgi:hypothetical protein